MIFIAVYELSYVILSQFAKGIDVLIRRHLSSLNIKRALAWYNNPNCEISDIFHFSPLSFRRHYLRNNIKQC